MALTVHDVAQQRGLIALCVDETFWMECCVNAWSKAALPRCAGREMRDHTRSSICVFCIILALC